MAYYHMKIDEAVKMIAWLVENGCPVNMQNADGDTPLHVALTEQTDPLVVRALILRGANPRTVKNHDGKSCFDILNGDAHIRKTYADEMAYAINLPPRGPVHGFDGKMKGYSYLSIYFGSQDFDKALASVHEQPMLLVSACNSKRELVETVSEIRGPVLVHSQENVGATGAKKVYWGLTWHMRTPVENLEAGSYVLIEYKARVDGPIVSTGYLPLERESIDSKEITIALTAGVDASAGGRQANPIMMQNEKAALTMEVQLTRKAQSVAFESLYLAGAQPSPAAAAASGAGVSSVGTSAATAIHG
eukprot:gene17499-12515_t